MSYTQTQKHNILMYITDNKKLKNNNLNESINVSFHRELLTVNYKMNITFKHCTFTVFTVKCPN